MSKIHKAVLSIEVIDNLDIQKNNWYIDATFGRGGHSKSILDKGGKVLAFDIDQDAIEFAEKNFNQYIENKQFQIVRENFANMKQIVDQLKKEGRIDEISGILFDFGTSTDQLKSASRGFSFEHPDQELDMRMDDRLTVKAKDLLAVMSQEQLKKIFQIYGGEYQAKSIAKKIVNERKQGKTIKTGQELINIIKSIKQRKASKLHPATKVFQALRIAVNDELNVIKKALKDSLKIIEEGGKIVTISFHEGEDRIVKHLFREWMQKNIGTQINKKVITPSEGELCANPRSRSAKMRIFKYEKRAHI